MRRRRLGELEQMVLMAVIRLKDDAYGTTVMRVMDERGGRPVSPGSLFATVDRLEERGYLKSRPGDPVPGRGGKRRRLLSVTQSGLAALREAREAWERMLEGLEGALGK